MSSHKIKPTTESAGWSMRARRLLFGLMPLALCLFVSGCRMDMQDQPRYEVYEPSSFFKNGLSSRTYPEGTVPRGYLRADTELYTGKRNKAQAAQSASSGQNTQGQQNQTGPGAMSSDQGATSSNGMSGQGTRTNGAATAQAAQASSGANTAQSGGTTAANAYPDDVDTFPFPITQQVLDRGEERYKIFCSVCHGVTGYGDGMIVRRGYRKPPSYYEDRLRKAPVGHFYDVITNGWGAMPNYAEQVPVQDRWAIIAYIRALQATVPEGQGNTSSAQRPNNPETGGQR